MPTENTCFSFFNITDELLLFIALKAFKLEKGYFHVDFGRKLFDWHLGNFVIGFSNQITCYEDE